MHIELGRALVGLFLMVGVALGADTKQKPAVIGGVAVDWVLGAGGRGDSS